MSSELERLLRQGRDLLPEPDGEATERTREKALGAVKPRRPRRLRALAMVGAAVAVAAGLGTLVGATLTPSGEAAKVPVGFGFLPEDGWLVYQSGARATPDHPALAVASNRPLESEDVVGGLAEPSALPYASLLDLPARGIVLVATFSGRGEKSYDKLFSAQELPLQLADGSPYVDSGTQVRPAEPLGQLQVRGAVNGYNVDLTAYFGVPRPSPELLAEAQRQVNRLVVSSSKEAERAQRAVGTTRAASTKVVEKVLVCPTAMAGGLYGIEARAHAGVRQGASEWAQLPFAVVDTGNSAGRSNDPELLANSFAWVTAGRPSSITTMEAEWRKTPVRGAGTLGLNASMCKASRARVSLSPGGLRGAVAGPITGRVFCEGSRRVVVRVRATLEAPARLTASRGVLRTQATVRDAQIGVETSKGVKLVYADVRDTGTARLFTARSCEAK